MVIIIEKTINLFLGRFNLHTLLIENKKKNSTPRNIEAFKSKTKKYKNIIINVIR